MWIRGIGLTFVECGIATIIFILLLVVVLPVFSRNNVDFREENFNTNLAQLRQQINAYRFEHGGLSDRLAGGLQFKTLRTNPNQDVNLYAASPKKDAVSPYKRQISEKPHVARRVEENRVKAGLGGVATGNSGWIYSP